MSVSIRRAKDSGDDKYLLVSKTYKKWLDKYISKSDALSILGEKYKNTIRMW